MSLQVSGIQINGVLTVVEILGVIISTILSALLVYLYYQQRQILEQQTELTAAEQRALPRVRMYYLFSWLDQYWQQIESNTEMDLRGHPERSALFTAMISNPGKGFATDMRVELVIESPNYKHSVTHPLAFRTNQDQMMFTGEGGTLSPEEDEVQMTSFFVFYSDEISDELKDSDVSVSDEISPSELLWILHQKGESRAAIAIYIHYKDGRGIADPIQLLTSEYELDKYTDIRHAYEHGGPVDREPKPEFEY